MLGNIILSDGPDAHYAVDPLASVGDAAIPTIAKLLGDRVLDTQILASYTVMRLENPDEATFLKSIRPLLNRNPGSDRFGAILGLGAFPLSHATAALMTREQLQDLSYTSKLGAAILIARWSVDESLFQEMEQSPYAVVRYAGARYSEQRRREKQQGHRGISVSPMPPPLPAEEIARRKDADERLRRLALDALHESLGFLKNAHDPEEKLCLFHCIQFIYPDVESERASIAEVFRAVDVTRESLLDNFLRQWVIDHSQRSQ